MSHHQGAIDWPAVANDDIAFAYIKASEGGDFADSRFDANWQAASDAGLERGAYHFFTLCRSGAEQARWFLSRVEPTEDALPPAVDLELLGNCASRPQPADVHAELDAFLTLVEEAWRRDVVLYVGDDWADAYPVPQRLERPRWHLRFLRRPDIDNWVIWQIHGFARVDGVDGDVDLDIGRLDDLTDD